MSGCSGIILYSVTVLSWYQSANIRRCWRKSLIFQDAKLQNVHDVMRCYWINNSSFRTSFRRAGVWACRKIVVHRRRPSTLSCADRKHHDFVTIKPKILHNMLFTLTCSWKMDGTMEDISTRCVMSRPFNPGTEFIACRQCPHMGIWVARYYIRIHRNFRLLW